MSPPAPPATAHMLPRMGWGRPALSALPADAQRRLVAHAVARGLLLDTASGYKAPGAPAGDHERCLGRCLAALAAEDPERAARAAVLAKVWPVRDAATGEVAVEAQLRASLQRLGLPRVAACLAHRFDPGADPAAVVRAFSRCVEQGLCGVWGCSRWPTAKVAEAVAIARAEGLVAPQISQGPYSILGRDDGALRPWPHAHPPEGNGRRRVEVEGAELRALGVALFGFSPLGGALLSGRPAAAVRSLPAEGHAHRASVLGLLDRAKALEPVAAEMGLPLARMATAWCLREGPAEGGGPALHCTVTGASSPEQMDENLRALDAAAGAFTEAILERIDAAAGTRPGR